MNRKISEQEEHYKCLLCGSNELKLLKRYQCAYLVKCKICGFVFSRRIPEQQELVRHYEAYGRNDYLSPVTIKRYNELLDFFEIYRKTNNLLDIGCGIGYFLEQAIKRGWNTYGTEFTDHAADICSDKGIKMHKGELDPQNYQSGSFDVITSFEVLEHINNPIDEINSIKRILKNGGLFYFTTPNFSSFSRLILKDKWNVIAYPEHLSYYTPKTAVYLLKNNGFNKLKILTTGFSLTRIQKSLNISDQPNISACSDDERLRIRFEKYKFLKILKLLFNSFLTLANKGDTLKAYFIKN
ncbi:class I SAM-dependent methyltransferase [candidate division KSB1 bacterium]